MNGTSSAAPVTSGVVALMLEANPNLTWRDVKHILATTANQVDATIAPVTYTVGGQSLIAEPAWTTNAAGYKFHNWYGFGRINAEAAVAMAKTYTSYLPANGQLKTAWLPGSLTKATTIPDNSVAGLSDTVNVTSSGIKQIEAVQVELGGLTINEYSDLNIEIVSPNGTRSVIMPAYNGYKGNVTSLTYVLASNAFYGEPADGNWTVKVVDARAGNTGTLTTTKLRIFGR
jgi:subtilisin-like proprotein convertase family protein